jgi:hypothetical protein
MNNPPSLKLRRAKGMSNDEGLCGEVAYCNLYFGGWGVMLNNQFSMFKVQGKKKGTFQFPFMV